MQKQGACEPPEAVGNAREMGEVPEGLQRGLKAVPQAHASNPNPQGRVLGGDRVVRVEPPGTG